MFIIDNTFGKNEKHTGNPVRCRMHGVTYGKKQKNGPIIIFDGGFMEKYAIESLRISPAARRDPRDRDATDIPIIIATYYYTAVWWLPVAGDRSRCCRRHRCRRRRRHGGAHAIFVIIFIFSFTSFYPRPIVHPRSVYVGRPSSVVCDRRPLLAGRYSCRTYISFFFPIVFFLLGCVFFHCYCSLCAEETRVEGRRTRTIFSHVVDW